MSDRIDQRIVEMSFENDKFEKGILQSKNSLKDFSNALSNMGTGKDFSALDHSVQTLSSSFSILEQIGIGALRRIGEAAVNAGAKIVKSLSIDPIAQGFNEMELKMNSTQTIMASTGETLATVNGYLQELNEYSDKTIYSFAHMTQNIGKFTNAGVKLDKAVASIKGISNAAALAGASSEEASRAMYNFAQALSAGYVKLVDWKSIELANMATVEFKQQLLDSAVAAGTLTKNIDGMYTVLSTDMAGKTMEQTISATRNFNDSLQFQWMTTEALTGTLEKYADETTDIGKRASKAATQVTTFTKLMATLKESVGSGWSQTFEILFGDFNEARDLWSSMNDTLGKTINELSDMRNALLSGGLGSGWKQFMKEGIADTTTFADTLAVVAGETGIDIDNIVKNAGSMEKAVKQNWVTGEMLIKTVSRMSSSIENLSGEELKNAGYTEKTKSELLALRDALLSGSISADEFAKKMGMMSGRENIIQGLKNSVVALLTALKPISKAFDKIFPPKTASQLYDITEIFKNFTKQLIITEETANKIQRTFAGFFAVIDIGWTTVKFLGSAFLEITKTFIPITGGFLDITASMGDFLVVLDYVIKKSGVFQYGLLALKVGATIARNAFISIIKTISEFASELWNADKPLEYIGLVIQKVFDNIINSIKMGISWISGGFINALSKASIVIDDILGKNTNGVLANILSIVKEFIDLIVDKGTGGLKGLGDVIRDLDLNKIATFVTGGVLLLFITQLTQLTSAMTGVLNTTNTFMTKFSKKLFGTQTKLKDLAFTIGVLSASLYVLSNIPWTDLKHGLLGLAGAIGLFVGAYAGIQTINVIATKMLKGKDMVKSAFNLVGIASGLAIMAGALKIISSIDSTVVFKSVGVLGSMMAFLISYQALYTAISLIPGTGKLSVNLAGMAAGILGLIGAIVLLDKITEADIKNGLSKLATILFVIGAIETVFGFAARVTLGNKLTTNMFSMAGGILALLGVMKLLSLFNSRDLTKGIGNLFLLGSVFAGLEILFGLAGRLGGGKKFKTHILETQISMLSMIGLMKVLSFMTKEEIDNGITNLAKMGGIIAGIEVLTALSARIAGGKKTQRILGALTLTLLSFTGAIALLGFLPTETTDKGIVTLMKMVGLIAAIELITALASRVSVVIDKSGNAVKGGSMFASLIGVVLAVITLTGSLALLSIIDQKSLRKASISLAIAAVAVGTMSIGLGVMMKALSTMSGNLSNFKSMAKGLLSGLAVLGIVILSTVALLGTIKMVSPMLESIQWSTVGKFAVGLGLVSSLVLAFSYLSNNKLGNWKTGLQSLIPGFAGMTGVVIATAGFFKALGWVLPIVDSVSWDSFNKFIAGLGLIGGLTLAMTILGPLFAALGTVFVPALGGVLTAITGVGLILAAFVGLSVLMEKIFGSNPDLLTNGIDKLVLVGQGIGKFIGAMAGGFKSEVLREYGQGLAEFADAVDGIGPSSFDGIKTLSEAILTITGSSIREGISQFVNFGKNSGEVFGEQLNGLISAFKNIPIEDAVQTTKVLGALGPMSTNLAKLAEAAKTIPNSGELLGILVGENNIDAFGKKLVGLVDAFKDLDLISVNKVSMVFAALAPMSNNLTLVAEAAQAIPNSGWMAAFIMGNNDINKFGEKLVDFIGAFSTIDVDMDVNHTSNVLSAMAPMMNNLRIFGEAAQAIPNSGWLSGFVMGNNDINKFGEKLAELVTTFGKIDTGELNTASTSLYIMGINMVPAIQGFITAANNLETNNGTSLIDFALVLKHFTSILGSINFTVVQPALQSLSQINESFASVGSEILQSAITSFENNKVPFQTAIINFLTDAITTVNEKRDIISTSFAQLFQDAVGKSRDSIKDFKQLGADLVLGLRDGIISKKPVAVDAAIDVANSVETAVQMGFQTNSPRKPFTEIGGWIPKSIGNGIKRNSNSAILAGITMSQAVEEGIRNTTDIHSESDTYNDIGGWIPDSIGFGIEDKKQMLLNKAKELGLDMTSITTEGIVEGLKNGEGAVTVGLTSLLDVLNGNKSIEEFAGEIGADAGGLFSGAYANAIAGPEVANAYTGMAKDAFQIFKESIDYRKEYNLISLEEELAEWENFSRKYAAGTEIRMKADKELARVRSELDAKSFENSKRWIEDEKYYKRLNLLDELAAWERVQKRYAEGHEYRMQAERELFRLKEELKQAEYQNSLNWIDQEKYYKRLSLGDELAAWKRIQARYKKFEDNNTKSEERKQAEREVYRLEQEINEQRKQLEDDYYNKTQEINKKLIDDIKRVNDEYDDALQNRTQSLTNAWGIFDEVANPTEPVTGKQLLSNLEGQVIAFSSWQDQLDALRKKGMSDILLDELEAMGPTSLEQIKALNQLSEPELDRYVMLWQKKHRQAKTQATSELVDLRRDTDQQIVQLTKEADIELESYRKVWEESMAEIGKETITSTTATTVTTLTILKTFAASTLAVFKQLKSDIMSTAQDNNLEEAGTQVSSGLAKGITLGTTFVITAMKALTSNIRKTTESELEIHSPSRVGLGIGANYAKAIGSGMLSMLKYVTGPSESLAISAVDIMSRALSGIDDILNYDYDLQPTIIPVLDMSKIDAGLDKAFNTSRELALSDVAIKSTDNMGIQEIYATALRQRKVVPAKEDIANNTINNTDESRVQIVNNYSVRNDNDIRKISRDQKNLLDRYNLARGVTT